MVRDCSQALVSPGVLCMVSWRLNEITAEQVGAGTTLEVYIAVPPALGWNGLPVNGRRPRGRTHRDGPTAFEQDGGRGMMKRWQRVSMDASAEDGITIIRITRGRPLNPPPGSHFVRRADTMIGWRVKRMTIFTALALCLGTSYSIAFDPDAVERLKSKPVCPDCDLSGVSMKEAYLPGAILTNSDLTDAKLIEANLNGANLSSATLVGADLSRASIKYSVLTGTDLRGAQLAETKLTGANLEGANLSGAVLTGAELRGARLSQAQLSGANLERANLEFAEGLETAQLIGAKLCKTRMPDGLFDNSGC